MGSVLLVVGLILTLFVSTLVLGVIVSRRLKGMPPRSYFVGGPEKWPPAGSARR